MTIELKGGATTEDPRLDRIVAVAWLAGVCEGEGSFGVTNAGSANGAAMRVRMTDEDVVRRCQAVAGVGSVTGPTVYAEPRKPTWQWSVYRRDDLLPLLEAIRPFMGQRRGARIDDLLERLRRGDGRSRPFVHGTAAGYHRHRDHGEEACGPCRLAHAEKCRRQRRRHAVT